MSLRIDESHSSLFSSALLNGKNDNCDQQENNDAAANSEQHFSKIHLRYSIKLVKNYSNIGLKFKSSHVSLLYNLYELSDDAKRKEWLDDWLSFMHRIVEIINKKLWREITKGLNLPSSITSAAFTLRTQEGRRNTSAPSFGHLGYPIPHPSSAANLLGKHLNGLGMRNG
uniref:Uncharacterized protein n=1 Tax=Heterorhabditis bacteriophora TaxID=37862 RepID=A0A1I7WLD1_HETBA